MWRARGRGTCRGPRRRSGGGENFERGAGYARLLPVDDAPVDQTPRAHELRHEARVQVREHGRQHGLVHVEARADERRLARRAREAAAERRLVERPGDAAVHLDLHRRAAHGDAHGRALCPASTCGDRRRAAPAETRASRCSAASATSRRRPRPRAVCRCYRTRVGHEQGVAEITRVPPRPVVDGGELPIAVLTGAHYRLRPALPPSVNIEVALFEWLRVTRQCQPKATLRRVLTFSAAVRSTNNISPSTSNIRAPRRLTGSTNFAAARAAVAARERQPEDRAAGKGRHAALSQWHLHQQRYY